MRRGSDRDGSERQPIADHPVNMNFIFNFI